MEVAKGFELELTPAEDEPSTRAARAFLKEIGAKVEEVKKCEATASQLRGEIANAINCSAPELAEQLSFEDCTTLLRLVAEIGRGR